MKKLVSSILLLGVLISCGETKEKKNDQNISEDKSQPIEASKTLPSADYSSLLVNYECDMTPSEVARALSIPEADVSLAEYQYPGRCTFVIKGFGENTLGDDTIIVWFLEKLGKAQVAKEIKSYLDDQANNESVLGMGIQLSDTGDCYITKQPMHGRVAIMNANYDSWMFLSYNPKHMYKSRTQEQHDALGEKTIALANYLLKKHKK